MVSWNDDDDDDDDDHQDEYGGGMSARDAGASVHQIRQQQHELMAGTYPRG